HQTRNVHVLTKFSPSSGHYVRSASIVSFSRVQLHRTRDTRTQGFVSNLSLARSMGSAIGIGSQELQASPNWTPRLARPPKTNLQTLASACRPGNSSLGIPMHY